jgi:hypothetical protein
MLASGLDTVQLYYFAHYWSAGFSLRDLQQKGLANRGGTRMRLTETQRKFRQEMAKVKNNDSIYDDHLNRRAQGSPRKPRKANWAAALFCFYVAAIVLTIQIGSSRPPTVQTVPSEQVVTTPSRQLSAQLVPPKWSSPLQAGLTIPAYSGDGNQTIDKKFSWQYDNRSYSWSVSVPAGLLAYDRQINSFMSTYFRSNGNMQAATNNSPSMTQNMMSMITACSTRGNDNYIVWIDEPYNSAWISSVANSLANSAHSSGYDYYHEADFILSLVGSAIPYKTTTDPELPAQTLVDSGDCKDKSILYASLLKTLGYQVVLLHYSDVVGDTGHVAVGVALDDSQLPQDRSLSYYSFDGLKYYYAETTAPNWTVGDEEGSIVQDRSAKVYAVN